MVVALIPRSNEKALPFMILTLWPCLQKTKPTPRSIPLQLVKVFRAVLLKETDNDAVLQATDYCWLFGPENIFAVLDAEEHDTLSGTITLSASSVEALRKLQEKDISVAGDGAHGPRKRRRRLGVKPKAGAKKKAKNPGEKAKKVLDGASKQQKKLERQFTAEDFRRSNHGRSSIQAMVTRMRERERLLYPADPCFDSDGMCTISGLGNVTWKAFISKLPNFFEAKFWRARRPADFGGLVFNDLMVAWNPLNVKENPCRKMWIALIKEVHKVMGLDSQAIQC